MKGLQKIVDLGEWWAERTGGLPLPLGGNIIRRDLGPEMIAKVSKLLHDSIAYALSHRPDAVEYALQFGRGLDRAKTDRFVGMYVNDLTLATASAAGSAGTADDRRLRERPDSPESAGGVRGLSLGGTEGRGVSCSCLCWEDEASASWLVNWGTAEQIVEPVRDHDERVGRALRGLWESSHKKALRIRRHVEGGTREREEWPRATWWCSLHVDRHQLAG